MHICKVLSCSFMLMSIFRFLLLQVFLFRKLLSTLLDRSTEKKNLLLFVILMSWFFLHLWKNVFAGYRIMGWQFFSFDNVSFGRSKYHDEKSVSFLSLIFTPYVSLISLLFKMLVFYSFWKFHYDISQCGFLYIYPR